MIHRLIPQFSIFHPYKHTHTKMIIKENKILSEKMKYLMAYIYERKSNAERKRYENSYFFCESDIFGESLVGMLLCTLLIS